MVITSRAAVAIASKTTVLREFALPEVPPDGGLLRVISAGICGSDVPYYAEGDKGSRILGHENVGIIEKIGSVARANWGVNEGDLVALEEYLPCGYCAECRSGEYRSCVKTDNERAGALRYGSTSIDIAPALWGGYSEFQYLHPRSILHRVPAGIAPRIASMALPIGNGFQWTVLDGRAGPGQTVVVQGPGQQGLACIVAAKAAGAQTIIATGLARDAHRLEVAKRLGADYTVKVDEESLADVVRHATDGKLADLIIDSSSGGATQVVNGALELIRKRGTLIVAAYKRKPVDGFAIDSVIRQQIDLRGVRGHSFQAVEMALALMASHRIDLEAMSTHEFGLDEVDHALRLVEGEFQDGAIHCSINPWMR